MSLHAQSANISTPPLKTRHLPPEVVCEILGYIDCPSSFRRMDAVLDLMAASMVCTEWYGVAYSKILSEDLGYPFLHTHTTQYDADLQRLASLLSTAQKLGLPYCDNVKSFGIDVECFIPYDVPEDNFGDKAAVPPNNPSGDIFDSRQDSIDALFTIINLTKPQYLELITEKTNVRGTPKRVRTREQFFSHLKQHCDGVRELAIKCNGSVYMNDVALEDDPCLADIVRSVSSSLTSLYLMLDPDPITLETLSACQSLEVAAFYVCSAQTVNTVLRGSPKIQQVQIHSVGGDGVDELMDWLSSPKGQMQRLGCESISWHLDISQTE